MIKRSDEEVIRQLQSDNERSRDQALTYLYKVSQPIIRNFILKNKGTAEDVDDIFHDGLIAFYNLARQGKLKLDTNVEAYLYTICRNMWRKKLINSPLQVELTETFNTIPIDELPIDRLFSEERKHLLNTILEQLGKDCRQLLHYYYYERLRMKGIVEKMNLSNEQVARNKKSGCMKKLRKIVLNSPVYKKLLQDK